MSRIKTHICEYLAARWNRNSRQSVDKFSYLKRGDNLTLKDYRLKAGLRQEDVAKILEVGQAAVSCWERGKTRPVKKYRAKLSKLYGYTVDELLANEPSEK